MNMFSQFPIFRSTYATMTRTEKRIAEYIAAHNKTIINETISDLALHTNSSEITISRFCKKLGFSGLQSLKITLAADIATAEDATYHTIRPEDTTDIIAARIFQNIMDGLQDTLKILDFSAIDRAADALIAARQILVFGFGNSATVCKDIETRFLRFGFLVHAYNDSHMQGTTSALAQKGDVIIAVSHKGATRELLENIKVAKKAGVTIIGITSYVHSPLAEISDIILSGMGREVHFCSEAVSSRLIHMAITDVLYMRIAMKQPDTYEENMTKMRAVIAQKRLPKT